VTLLYLLLRFCRGNENPADGSEGTLPRLSWMASVSFGKRSRVISDTRRRERVFRGTFGPGAPILLVVFCLPKEIREVTLRQRVAMVLLLIGTTGSGLAQTRGGALTIRTTTIGPIIALVAGILILLVPRVLNYVVAVYLILIGLIGLFGV
jgi:hypothetical protein